eukprot:TRINITY_DN19860_c0_g1_i1.p1 TRINITY_DN19860_c0_g1~~TRINITY_DN19860_c0_g1_i1.p1  ORF type:complete len:243 (-),score=35.36 TRINITY_DN19860_c0_g1_i1:121-849(-)
MTQPELHALLGAARVSLLAGDSHSALGKLQHASVLLRDMAASSAPREQAYHDAYDCTLCLGRAYRQRGELEAATVCFDAAQVLAQRRGGVHDVLQFLCHTLCQDEDYGDAGDPLPCLQQAPTALLAPVLSASMQEHAPAPSIWSLKVPTCPRASQDSTASEQPCTPPSRAQHEASPSAVTPLGRRALQQCKDEHHPGSDLQPAAAARRPVSVLQDEGLVDVLESTRLVAVLKQLLTSPERST